LPFFSLLQHPVMQFQTLLHLAQPGLGIGPLPIKLFQLLLHLAQSRLDFLALWFRRNLRLSLQLAHRAF
jgi:hypothetical protein